MVISFRQMFYPMFTSQMWQKWAPIKYKSKILHSVHVRIWQSNSLTVKKTTLKRVLLVAVYFLLYFLVLLKSKGSFWSTPGVIGWGDIRPRWWVWRPFPLRHKHTTKIPLIRKCWSVLHTDSSPLNPRILRKPSTSVVRMLNKWNRTAHLVHTCGATFLYKTGPRLR